MFERAKTLYAELGVDVESALATLAATPISLHCWQGDDVGGFENPGATLGSGLAVTGNYPGKARSLDELRQDIDKVLSLVPGRHRLNLHAIYGDFTSDRVERDELSVEHFQSWIEWCRERSLGIDFNPTCFSHPKADDGFTLSHPDSGIRSFWIRHCQRCREIGAAIGAALGSPTITNIWIPDGMKDLTADRLAFRRRLEHSLDEIFHVPLDPAHCIDAIESKLFGIGSETFVVGSHEFYLAYAVKNQKALCLDAGHFHPTESMADKISSLVLFIPRLLLHVSRGVRWDSDHVVILDDQTLGIMRELVACKALSRVHIGLDFFDASINRIAAWTLGMRAAQKALLISLLEPRDKISAAEAAGDYTARLALFEQAKCLPWGVVWAEFCLRHNVPQEGELIETIKDYEQSVLSKRRA